MNKAEIVALVAKRTHVSKRMTEAVINSFLKETIDALATGNSVKLVGFGTFKMKSRAARKGRNWQGEVVEISPVKTPAFIPGETFKERVRSS